jgi:hypothetical protein
MNKENNTLKQQTTQDHEITKINRQADVLDQTRLRPPSTVQRYNYDGKIGSLLLNLKSLEKADLTVKFVSDRLKYIAKYANLDDPYELNLFIARKRCLDSYKDGLMKAYNHYPQFYDISYVKPKFRSEKKLPRIASREGVIAVISASSKKYATIFRLLMETGVMPFDLARAVCVFFSFAHTRPSKRPLRGRLLA